MFITFEGGEGTGKSTQAKLLAERVRDFPWPVVLTREPGGTEQGEILRNLLVNGDPSRWSATAEALLNYAARDAHIRSVIRPAMERGDVVICDRFMDSTRAYQGFAGKCPMELIDELERSVVRDCYPTLTLVFDMDPAVGLARAAIRGAGIEDRYEKKGAEFHRDLREGFLQIANANPARCKIIDASRTVEQVHKAVMDAYTAIPRHG
jgi:dTMP kinase